MSLRKGADYIKSGDELFQPSLTTEPPSIHKMSKGNGLHHTRRRPNGRWGTRIPIRLKRLGGSNKSLKPPELATPNHTDSTARWFFKKAMESEISSGRGTGSARWEGSPKALSTKSVLGEESGGLKRIPLRCPPAQVRLLWENGKGVGRRRRTMGGVKSSIRFLPIGLIQSGRNSISPDNNCSPPGFSEAGSE